MNKKIMDSLIDKATFVNHVSGPYYENSFDEYEFANLIIKECIRLVSEPSGLRPEYKIKEYFGIKDE